MRDIKVHVIPTAGALWTLVPKTIREEEVIILAEAIGPDCKRMWSCFYTIGVGRDMCRAQVIHVGTS